MQFFEAQNKYGKHHIICFFKIKSFAVLEIVILLFNTFLVCETKRSIRFDIWIKSLGPFQVSPAGTRSMRQCNPRTLYKQIARAA